MNLHKHLWLLTLLLLVTLTACEPAPETTPEETAADTSTAMLDDEPAPAEPVEKLNLNTATGEEFRTIPDVGDRMVHEFEEYRPYVSIQQFRQEIGKYVDEAQVAAYEAYVYVPIDRNESDAVTLQQIPGLTAAAAEELITGRPYDSNEAFLEKLGDYISVQELTIAGQYLTSE
jgi:DNA uptake protein ComE-like DNA-binding protein